MSTGQLTEVTREFEHGSLEEAQKHAQDHAAATGGRVYPCIVFRQGKRTMIATSFPYSFIKRQIVSDPAVKGESPRAKTNRPLIPEHVRTIQNYMRENSEQYIMPPVTLNVRHMPQVHVHRSNAATRSGYLVVDDSTKFYVTDGQHRIAAISGHNAGKRPSLGIVDEIDDFLSHGLAVQVVYEKDMDNIHQDFADAAHTKAIPASLLATYNMREPVNRVLTKVVEDSFLSGRVEETSKTLPKMSQYLYLLNQVRGFIKELLVSDYAMAEPALDRNAKELIGTPETQSKFIESAILLLDVLSAEMTPWKEIRSSSGDQNVRIPDYRKKYLNMTATGLVIIGRVAHVINKTCQSPDERATLYRRLASEVDWRRNAPIWRGSVVNEEDKVQTQRSPVKIAVSRVLDQLGLTEEKEPTEAA